MDAGRTGGVVRTLRALSSRYIDARDAASQLRSRSAEIIREHTERASDASRDSEHDLYEIWQIRRALELSTAVSQERLRALEAIITSVAIHAGAALRPPDAPARAAELASPPATADTLTPLRGGWSPPDVP